MKETSPDVVSILIPATILGAVVVGGFALPNGQGGDVSFEQQRGAAGHVQLEPEGSRKSFELIIDQHRENVYAGWGGDEVMFVDTQTGVLLGSGDISFGDVNGRTIAVKEDNRYSVSTLSFRLDSEGEMTWTRGSIARTPFGEKVIANDQLANPANMPTLTNADHDLSH